jgi:hypothetical protein
MRALLQKILAQTINMADQPKTPMPWKDEIRELLAMAAGATIGWFGAMTFHHFVLPLFHR